MNVSNSMIGCQYRDASPDLHAMSTIMGDPKKKVTCTKLRTLKMVITKQDVKPASKVSYFIANDEGM